MRLILILAAALAAFLAFGFYLEKAMAGTARELTAMLAETEDRIGQGDLEKASKLLRRFESRWSKAERYWALITEHREMDEVHMTLDRADRFLAERHPAEARAELSALRFLIGHIPVKESLGLRTVF